jgi:hypothetical protein
LHKGYIQWQGLTVQELLWDNLDAYLNDPTKKQICGLVWMNASIHFLSRHFTTKSSKRFALRSILQLAVLEPMASMIKVGYLLSKYLGFKVDRKMTSFLDC